MEFIAKFGTYFEIVTQVVGVASMIAAVTPTTKDDSIVKKVKTVIDFFAFNFWNAKK